MYRSSVEGTSKEAVTKVEKLIRNVNEDIAVVRDRVHSPNVGKAREKVEGSLKQWSASVLRILKPADGGQTEIPAAFVVARQGDAAIAAIDDLVEIVAAYGFDYRTEAEAAVAASRTTMAETPGFLWTMEMVPTGTIWSGVWY